MADSDTTMGSLGDTQRLLDEAPDILSRQTPEGRILEVSAACRRVLGYAPQDMVGRMIFDFFHPDEVFRSKRAQDAAVRRLGEHVASYRLRHANGSYVLLEMVSRVLVDPATGSAGDVITVSRNLSGRDVEQGALRQSETLYRRIFDEASIPCTLTDANYSALIRINSAFCRLVGYSRAELRDINLQVLTHPGDWPAVLQSIHSTVSGEDAPIGLPFRVLRKDGSSVAIEADVALLRDDQGRPKYFVCQMRPRASRSDSE